MKARSIFVIAVPTVLSACGGAGGGTDLAVVSPPPQTSPPPAGSVIGLKSNQEFETLGVSFGWNNSLGQGTRTPTWSAMTIRYNPSTNSYEASVPEFTPGRLEPQELTTYPEAGGKVVSNVTSEQSAERQELSVTTYLPNTPHRAYTYTSVGSWSGKLYDQPGVPGPELNEGVFVYGIPAAQADIPISGTASYSAEIIGGWFANSKYEVSGTAKLNFDFLGGNLDGSFNPIVSYDGSKVLEASYALDSTVYARGSTSFSGSFSGSGLPDRPSAFEGMFTGPNASELMARWQAFFAIDDSTFEFFGVMIGKKD